MKNFALVCMLALACFASTGCETGTNYGECLGLSDQADRNPDLEYRLSVRNIIVSVVFSEMLFIPPLYTLFEAYECPVGPQVRSQQN